MKRKSIWIALSIAAVLAIVPLVFADVRHGGEHGPLAILERVQKVADELGLTADQRSDIRTIFTDVRGQNATYRQQIRANMREAGKVLLADPNDVAGAQAILDRNADAERQLKANVLQGISHALNVLTPDQRVKLGDILARHAGRG
jgi:Spy/CpxP family protein refolding chaperone